MLIYSHIMLVLKRMNNEIKLSHLQCSFPRLTDKNQQYVIGLVEGLKYAQGNANGKVLVKKEVIKFKECNKNDVC